MVRRQLLANKVGARVAFIDITLAIGLFLGINPLYTAFIVSIIAVLAISYMKRQGLAESDSAIAVILAIGFSTGLIIISLAGGFNVELFSFLFGSILTISETDMILVALLGAVSLVLVMLFYKELLSITFDAQASRLMGIPVDFLSNIFNILVAITVVLSIKVVGMILVTALLVLPGLTSLQLSMGFRNTAILSILFGVGSVIMGIFASAVLDVATSGVIVFTLVLVFIIVSAITRISQSMPIN